MMTFLAAHWLDITTTILGILYILLEVKANIAMWLVGFLMQSLGIVLYYQKGLYADCGMEFYYLAMTVYGFIAWKRGTKRQKSSPSITRFPRRLILPWLCAITALWMLIFWILVRFTDSTVPLADSFTTALSVVGIWALAHKYLEQWFIWLAVDVVTCVLYFHKGIPFKASLYALYCIIAVIGYFNWKRQTETDSKE